MDFRATCTLQAASAIAGAAALLLLTEPFLSLLGLQGAHAALLARFAAAMLLALGATLFAARDLTDATAQRHVALGNALADTLVFALCGWSTHTGLLTAPAGWGLAVLFAVNVGSWLIVTLQTGGGRHSPPPR
jgi:hypothetical protein